MKAKFKLLIITLAVVGLLASITLVQATLSVVHAATFTVTTTADAGAGSFRQAITDANASVGADVIAFAVPGCGPGTTTVCTIAPTSALPDIIESVMMNGALDNGNPGVEIDGTNAGGVLGGLILKDHTDSTIEGVIVNSFTPVAGLVNVGNGLLISGGGEHTVRNSYFGTDSTGTLARSNKGEGIHLFSSSNNLIENNVCSGSLEAGIQLRLSDNNTVRSNKVGVDVNGDPLGNASSGIIVQGDSNIIEDNVIRANRLWGIFVTDANDNQVIDNIIADNFMYGIAIANIAENNLIARNIIDNNSNHGIYIGSLNFIFGAHSVFQLLGAITAPVGPVGNRIEENTITNHRLDGVHVAGDLDDAVTAYCTDPTFEAVDAGTIAKQTDFLDGVIVAPADLENDKCQLFDAPFGFDTVPIVDGIYQENLCGTVADLVNPSPAPCDGTAVDNSILANAIYDNGGLAINLSNSQDVVLNLGFGVLDTFAASTLDGPTLNDNKDADMGANNLQNFPALNSAHLEGGEIRVQGLLKSERDKSYRLDFYANPAGTSAPVQGKTHLGFIEVSTNHGGNTNYDSALVIVAGSVAVGDLITTTATEILDDLSGSEDDVYGSTSEFSAATAVTSP